MTDRGTPPPVPPEWFVEYYREHHKDLLRVALLAGVGGVQDAEDVVAGVMVRVLSNGVKDVQHPHRYFCTAVMRAVFSEHRRRSRRPVDAGLVEEMMDASTEAQFNVWEDEQWLASLLMNLPKAQRETMLFIYEGFSAREIAEHLGRTEATVRSNLRFARQVLKKQLDDRGSAGPENGDAGPKETS